MGAGTVGMGLFVGGYGKLRDVGGHGTLGQVETDMTAAGASFFGNQQGQIDRIGDKIGLQEQAFLLPFFGEVVRLTVETFFKIVFRVKDEIHIIIKIDYHGGVRNGHEARGIFAGAVKVLVPGIEGNGKQSAGFPFKGHPFPGIVPDGG